MAWIAAIVQGVMGGIQMGISMDQLSKLPSAKTFSPATDLETATSMARRAAQQGMTPQERAAAEQAIGTAQSRTQRAMEQRGLGNLAAAVSQIRTTEAMNQLEAQNQAIKRQSLGQYASLAGQMQSIQNQNIQSFNQMLYAQQQALGQAAQAGFKNLAGTGASIAEAIEGKKAVEDKTHENTPGGKVTTGQMGVTDSGIQTSTPEGFNVKSMQQEDATVTGLTESEATSRIQNPSMQFGQQTTSGLDQVYPMQSFYDPSAANAFNALNSGSFNTGLSGPTTLSGPIESDIQNWDSSYLQQLRDEIDWNDVFDTSGYE
jgi:hypothetical protein